MKPQAPAAALLSVMPPSSLTGGRQGKGALFLCFPSVLTGSWIWRHAVLSKWESWWRPRNKPAAPSPCSSCFNQQKIICRGSVRCDHIIISSCSFGRRIGRRLGRQSCMILHELHRQMEALLRRSFRPQEVLTRNPSRSSTVLKRNHAVKQQVSLFWMEPALGDAVSSSVPSVSWLDRSHQRLVY